MRPPKIFLSASVAFCLHGSVSARIGESPAECIQRYGEPFKKTRADRLLLRKGDLEIFCRFHDAKCVAIIFSKVERDASDRPIPLTDTEIETLLKANGGGSTWKVAQVEPTNKYFYTTDDWLMASHDIEKRSLFITTQEAARLHGKESRDKEKEKLEGS